MRDAMTKERSVRRDELAILWSVVFGIVALLRHLLIAIFETRTSGLEFVSAIKCGSPTRIGQASQLPELRITGWAEVLSH
jgi:hypothetical protein